MLFILQLTDIINEQACTDNYASNGASKTAVDSFDGKEDGEHKAIGFQSTSRVFVAHEKFINRNSAAEAASSLGLVASCRRRRLRL